MKKINTEASIQILVLLVCAVLLAVLLVTGLIGYFVHPRLIKYLWFAVVALIAVAVSIVPLLHKPRRGFSPASYFLLMVPIAVGLANPVEAPASSTIELGGKLMTQQRVQTAPADVPPAPSAPERVLREIAPGEDPLKELIEATENTSINAVPNKTFQEDSLHVPVVEAPPASQPQTAPESTEPQVSAPPQQDFTTDEDVQVIDDADYMNWYMDAFDDPEKYHGKMVRLRGQVFRSPEFAANRFVPARMSMVCCAADMVAMGFMCESEQAAAWATDSWVWVTARIQVEHEPVMDMVMPVLYAVSIEAAEKPAEEFVYI